MKKLVLSIVAAVLPCVVFAQPPGGGIFPLDTPIDGGLSVLLAAGAAYGVHKIRKQQKEN